MSDTSTIVITLTATGPAVQRLPAQLLSFLADQFDPSELNVRIDEVPSPPIKDRHVVNVVFDDMGPPYPASIQGLIGN